MLFCRVEIRRKDEKEGKEREKEVGERIEGKKDARAWIDSAEQSGNRKSEHQARGKCRNVATQKIESKPCFDRAKDVSDECPEIRCRANVVEER